MTQTLKYLNTLYFLLNQPAAPIVVNLDSPLAEQQQQQPYSTLRHHLDSINSSEVSSHYGSNKSVIFAPSKVTIIDASNGLPLDGNAVAGSGVGGVVGGVGGGIRRRVSSSSSMIKRHRVISLNEDAGGEMLNGFSSSRERANAKIFGMENSDFNYLGYESSSQKRLKQCLFALWRYSASTQKTIFALIFEIHFGNHH